MIDSSSRVCVTNAIRRRVSAIACVSIVAVATAASAQTVTLRYRFAKGDSVTYQVTSVVESTLGGLPMGDLKLTQTMVQTLETTVEDVATDGTATLRETFKSEKMDMTTPMGLISYDTASTKPPAADPITGMIGAMLGSMIGESVTVVIAPGGSVQKVEGMAKLFEKISAKLPSDPTGGMLTASLKGMLDDESVRSMFEQAFGHFPDQAVKVGDAWPGELKLGSAATGRLIGSTTSTLKSIDAGVARVGVTLTLKQDGEPAAGPMGMTLKFNDGKGEGESLFDVDKGRMTRSTMRTESHSSVAGNGPDGSPMNATSAAVTTTTVEVVK
jgi:Family of unknown function (DUF6263)